MNINSAINEGSKILKSKFIPNPLLDAEILMAKTINKDRNYILLNYNNPINKNDLNTYESLADEKWKNRILVRSSSNAYNQALMASIIANNGIEKARNWSEGIVANLARSPKGNDRDQVKAIYSGLGDVAIVNSYYIGLLLSSEKEEERKNKICLFIKSFQCSVC